jgi:hypothetical protein
VREEIAHMERVTSEPRFDRDRVTSARWRISQASFKRRKLSAGLLKRLGTFVTAAEKLALKSLQESEHEMQRASQAHVSFWAIEKIEADWSAYCKASRTLRWRMDAYISMAESALCPLVERAERQGHQLLPEGLP